jgi:hypothetical protein
VRNDNTSGASEQIAAIKPPVVVRSISNYDTYEGTAEGLIAHGILTSDQLPGQPGKNKLSLTFCRGEPTGIRTRTRNHDEHYMQVVRKGNNRFVVYCGVPLDERARRMRGYTPQPPGFKTFMDKVFEPVQLAIPEGSERWPFEAMSPEAWAALSDNRKKAMNGAIELLLEFWKSGAR